MKIVERELANPHKRFFSLNANILNSGTEIILISNISVTTKDCLSWEKASFLEAYVDI